MKPKCPNLPWKVINRDTCDQNILIYVIGHAKRNYSEILPKLNFCHPSDPWHFHYIMWFSWQNNYCLLYNCHFKGTCRHRKTIVYWDISTGHVSLPLFVFVWPSWQQWLQVRFLLWPVVDSATAPCDSLPGLGWDGRGQVKPRLQKHFKPVSKRFQIGLGQLCKRP